MSSDFILRDHGLLGHAGKHRITASLALQDLVTQDGVGQVKGRGLFEPPSDQPLPVRRLCRQFVELERLDAKYTVGQSKRRPAVRAGSAGETIPQNVGKTACIADVRRSVAPAYRP